MDIWLATGESGDYSNYNMWVIGVAESAEIAKALCGLEAKNQGLPPIAWFNIKDSEVPDVWDGIVEANHERGDNYRHDSTFYTVQKYPLNICQTVEYSASHTVLDYETMEYKRAEKECKIINDTFTT